MSAQGQILDVLQRFGAVSRARISASATTELMREGRGEPGPNLQEGPGSLRRVTGRLARSITGAGGPESIFNVETTADGVQVMIGSRLEYAATHEFGFTGSVTVPAHTRTITKAFGRSIPATQVNVQSHVKSMNVPARPYLSPAIENEEGYLMDWLSKQMRPILENLNE